MGILALHYSSSIRHGDTHSLKYAEESAVQHFARVKMSEGFFFFPNSKV